MMFLLKSTSFLFTLFFCFSGAQVDNGLLSPESNCVELRSSINVFSVKNTNKATFYFFKSEMQYNNRWCGAFGEAKITPYSVPVDQNCEFDGYFLNDAQEIDIQKKNITLDFQLTRGALSSYLTFKLISDTIENDTFSSLVLEQDKNGQQPRAARNFESKYEYDLSEFKFCGLKIKGRCAKLCYQNFSEPFEDIYDDWLPYTPSASRVTKENIPTRVISSSSTSNYDNSSIIFEKDEKKLEIDGVSDDRDTPSGVSTDDKILEDLDYVEEEVVKEEEVKEDYEVKEEIEEEEEEEEAEIKENEEEEEIEENEEEYEEEKEAEEKKEFKRDDTLKEREVRETTPSSHSSEGDILKSGEKGIGSKHFTSLVTERSEASQTSDALSISSEGNEINLSPSATETKVNNPRRSISVTSLFLIQYFGGRLLL